MSKKTLKEKLSTGLLLVDGAMGTQLMANGGKPELVEGKAFCKLTDKEFGDWLEKIRNAGAVIAGGCCGTSPAHIKAMTKKLNEK